MPVNDDERSDADQNLAAETPTIVDDVDLRWQNAVLSDGSRFDEWRLETSSF